MKTVLYTILLLTLAGCANSFEKVKNAAASAPEWYGDAREEIIGEGYPDLATMPELSKAEIRQSGKALQQSQRRTSKNIKFFTQNARANEPVTTQIEIRALKEDLKAKLAASGPSPTNTPADLFLTEADLDRFRDIFERAEQR